MCLYGFLFTLDTHNNERLCMLLSAEYVLFRESFDIDAELHRFVFCDSDKASKHQIYSFCLLLELNIQ